MYDHRVYDLRNTTLDEVFNNRNEDTSFKEISIHDVVFDYDKEELEESQIRETAAYQGKLPTPTIESLDNNGVLTIKFD